MTKEGFKVLSVPDAAAAAKVLRRARPALIILDVLMPGISGLEFLRALRSDSEIPVILLSGKGEEIDRILGLSLGADDYLVKPFSVGELLARIAARLRRAASSNGPRQAVVGRLSADFERHEVRVSGRLTRLAPKEFAILKALIEAEGAVLSRERLLEAVWGHEAGLGLDTRTVDQHVARLRGKLGSEALRVKTVPNFGYQIRREETPVRRTTAARRARRGLPRARRAPARSRAGR